MNEEVRFPVNTEIGPYRVIRQIGQGAMGLVFEAYQKGLDRKVALKILPSHLVHDKGFLKRFQNEAASAARLNHPHIATVFDYGESSIGPYIAMEFILGETLEEYLLKTKPLSTQEALRISESLADALAYAHSHGIIHRDIKAANVMMDDTGRAVIMDFGLAKMDNATLLTLDGTILGTPAYMAPEQAQPDADHPASSGVDVYSLGVLMYEFFTGVLPFEGPNHMAVLKKVLEEDPPPPRRKNPKISKDLELVILKTLEKEPRRRYSAKVLCDDIRCLMSGEAVSAKPMSFYEKVYRKGKRHKTIILAIFLTGMIALAWESILIHSHRVSQEKYRGILREAQSRLMWVEGEKEVLLEKLSKDPVFDVLDSRDPLMRAQALVAINQRLREKELKGTLAQESFDRTLKALEDPHPLVRRHAAILLGILRDARARDALMKSVRDDDAEVRKHSLLALGLLRNRDAIADMIRSLGDTNEGVRANAALALGLLKAGEAAPMLIRALQDPFPSVRSNSAAALGAILDPSAIDPLVRLLADDVPEVRESAQEALSYYGDKAREPVLLATLRSSNLSKTDVIQALRGMDPERDREAFEDVVKLLKNEDAQVRYHAVLVLGLFQNEKAITPLIDRLQDEDRGVAENARLALIGLVGKDLGGDPEAWREWLDQQESE